MKYGLMLSFIPTLLLLTLGFIAPEIIASEYRHHEAHEHGVAHMNVALEGNNLLIELISPAANIVGFEHHPRDDAQIAAVRKAIETLEAGEVLFVFPPDAGGRLLRSTVQTDIKNESEDAHTHEQHGANVRDTKDKNQHKAHQGADEHERHSEFKAEYHFVCKKPERLTHIDVMLFRGFPGIEHIEVQLLTGTKQTALELTADKKRIIL